MRPLATPLHFLLWHAGRRGGGGVALYPLDTFCNSPNLALIASAAAGRRTMRKREGKREGMTVSARTNHGGSKPTVNTLGRPLGQLQFRFKEIAIGYKSRFARRINENRSLKCFPRGHLWKHIMQRKPIRTYAQHYAMVETSRTDACTQCMAPRPKNRKTSQKCPTSSPIGNPH